MTVAVKENARYEGHASRKVERYIQLAFILGDLGKAHVSKVCFWLGCSQRKGYSIAGLLLIFQAYCS